jgi:hypothetical protein
MSLTVYKMLDAEVMRRGDDAHIAETTMMCNLYEGELPPEYDHFFSKSAPKHVVQLVRDAWDDLAAQIGKLPDLRVDALKETTKEANLVEKLERIAYNYLDHAEPTGRLLMRQLAWWLVGTGRACVYIRPDHEGKMPVMEIKDHRNVFPNMRVVGNIPVEIYDVIFKYTIPRLEAIELGLAPALEEDGGLGQPEAPFRGESMEVDVCEMLDDQQHIIVSEFGHMFRSEHNLGLVPAWVFQNFNPNKPSGISLFKNQVSLMVAVSMLISLKLAAADRTVNPIYWAKGWKGSVSIGASVLNKLGPNGEIGRIDPPRLDQTDRDIAQLVEFSNVLNKHPEVRQGQVDTKGAYVSSKTLETLASALDTTVGDYWDSISIGMRHLFAALFSMDEKNWPKAEKRLSFNLKGHPVRDAYTPKKDIAGRYDIGVFYGFGIGGYQGFLQNMQANQAKMKSRKSAMMEMPGVPDVPKELRQIQMEDLDDAGMALIQTQAATGQMDMLTWANIRKEIANEGKALHEVIMDMQEALQEQAAAAAESGGVTEGVTAPAPEAPPGSKEGADLRALPGLNPGALV